MLELIYFYRTTLYTRNMIIIFIFYLLFYLIFQSFTLKIAVAPVLITG